MSIHQVGLCATDLRRLEDLLAARTTPLTLDDVHFHANKTEDRWEIFIIGEMSTVAYCMQWTDGVWVEL